MEDIGESLVGSYLRYVQGCEFVLFNTFLPGEQGEIDVIGIRLGTPRDIYFAEVTTHLDGMTYGGNKQTVAKVRGKLIRAHRFAQAKFSDDQHHFQVWSPRVAVGAMTNEFESMSVEFAARGDRLTFVVNQSYGAVHNSSMWRRATEERRAIRRSGCCKCWRGSGRGRDHSLFEV